MKAQASAEFVLIFMFLLAALVIGVMMSYNKTYEVSQSQIRLESDKILIKAANSINTAYLEGSGFSINITLPETLLGLNYSMQIDNNRVLLFYNNMTYSKSLLTRNISGQIAPGNNLIENLGGDVVIS